jgi:hypothetical protein
MMLRTSEEEEQERERDRDIVREAEREREWLYLGVRIDFYSLSSHWRDLIFRNYFTKFRKNSELIIVFGSLREAWDESATKNVSWHRRSQNDSLSVGRYQATCDGNISRSRGSLAHISSSTKRKESNLDPHEEEQDSFLRLELLSLWILNIWEKKWEPLTGQREWWGYSGPQGPKSRAKGWIVDLTLFLSFYSTQHLRSGNKRRERHSYTGPGLFARDGIKARSLHKRRW